jgi:hypothetical protein
MIQICAGTRKKREIMKIVKRFSVVPSVGKGATVTGYGAGQPKNRGSTSGRDRHFSLHSVQTGSGPHSASYPTGNGGKAAGA